MSSHHALPLPYEASALHYPDVRRVPRRFLLIFAVYVLCIPCGMAMLSSPLQPAGIVAGSVALAAAGVGLTCVVMLYCPLATWLRIGETGLAYSILFWHRSLPWVCVRELRLVRVEGRFGGTMIEILPTPEAASRQGRFLYHFDSVGAWTIATHLLGWSAEGLLQEMDDWRARGRS